MFRQRLSCACQKWPGQLMSGSCLDKWWQGIGRRGSCHSASGFPSRSSRCCPTCPAPDSPECCLQCSPWSSWGRSRCNRDGCSPWIPALSQSWGRRTWQSRRTDSWNGLSIHRKRRRTPHHPRPFRANEPEQDSACWQWRPAAARSQCRPDRCTRSSFRCTCGSRDQRSRHEPVVTRIPTLPELGNEISSALSQSTRSLWTEIPECTWRGSSLSCGTRCRRARCQRRTFRWWRRGADPVPGNGHWWRGQHRDTDPDVNWKLRHTGHWKQSAGSSWQSWRMRRLRSFRRSLPPERRSAVPLVWCQTVSADDRRPDARSHRRSASGWRGRWLGPCSCSWTGGSERSPLRCSRSANSWASLRRDPFAQSVPSIS